MSWNGKFDQLHIAVSMQPPALATEHHSLDDDRRRRIPRNDDNIFNRDDDDNNSLLEVYESNGRRGRDGDGDGRYHESGARRGRDGDGDGKYNETRGVRDGDGDGRYHESGARRGRDGDGDGKYNETRGVRDGDGDGKYHESRDRVDNNTNLGGSRNYRPARGGNRDVVRDDKGRVVGNAGVHRGKHTVYGGPAFDEYAVEQQMERYREGMDRGREEMERNRKELELLEIDQYGSGQYRNPQRRRVEIKQRIATNKEQIRRLQRENMRLRQELFRIGERNVKSRDVEKAVEFLAEFRQTWEDKEASAKKTEFIEVTIEIPEELKKKIRNGEYSEKLKQQLAAAGTVFVSELLAYKLFPTKYTKSATLTKKAQSAPDPSPQFDVLEAMKNTHIAIRLTPRSANLKSDVFGRTVDSNDDELVWGYDEDATDMD